MGMGASQIRLLGLLSAKNNYSHRLQELSMQEMALTRDAHKITKEYQQALNKKTLKWSQNNGLTYSDLTYSNLMRPTATNLNWPYLITDEGGSVVVDDYYKEYAEMLKENGGKYTGETRAKMLSKATGISENVLYQLVNKLDTSNDKDLASAAEAASLTTDEIRSVQFYDAIFIAMAQYGTKYVPDVSDKNYLNEMLMNNKFNITTVEYTTDLDFSTDTAYSYYEYNTNIAQNCTNVFKVNDDNTGTDALQKYESEKLIIKQKEQRIDTQKKNIETELEAINAMLDGIKQVMNKNIENTFSLFS